MLHFYLFVGRPEAVAWGKGLELLTAGPGINSRCCHVRRKFHPGHKCLSQHNCGPCLSIRPYLGESVLHLAQKLPQTQSFIHLNS